MAQRRKRRKPRTVAEMARLGGKTRMAQLTPAERAKLGREAAQIRWARVRAEKKQVKEP